MRISEFAFKFLEFYPTYKIGAREELYDIFPFGYKKGKAWFSKDNEVEQKCQQLSNQKDARNVVCNDDY